MLLACAIVIPLGSSVRTSRSRATNAVTFSLLNARTGLKAECLVEPSRHRQFAADQIAFADGSSGRLGGPPNPAPLITVLPVPWGLGDRTRRRSGFAIVMPSQ